MKGNENVVAALNEVLAAELTAINQYFVHSEMCARWGYKTLHAVARKNSIEEMRHAEWLIEQILSLDAVPSVHPGPATIKSSVVEQLHADLALEHDAVARLARHIQCCFEAGDHASRMLLETILKDEEVHIDWLEAQLNLVEQIGVQNYLAQQVGDSSGGPA